MMISLHMPKVAGNSFLLVLRKKFGKQLFKDYSDMARIQLYLAGDLSPMELMQSASVEPNLTAYRCIHGHFLAAKYLENIALNGNHFITWLREPVDRLVSHYNFFRRSFDPSTAGPLFRRVIEENWSFERFCFSEEFKNIYSKYLWNFPYEYFDFVGVSEFYEDDLRFFADKFLHMPAEAYKINCAIDNRVGIYDIDGGLRREIEEFHYEDVALYRRALQDRENRIGGFSL